MTVTKDLAQAVIKLGDLCLRLSRVDRITFHPNGRRPETDSDHTVMLAVIAPAFAYRRLDLDLGLVTQFAVVHDMVEAYAGDTPTLSITPAQLAMKKMKEELAGERIVDEFNGELPWLPRMIARYEAQIEPEARYVRAMDKLLPKITHILNQGATFGTVNGHMDQEALVRRYAKQLVELRAYASDFPELFELRAQLLGILFESINLEVSA